MRSNKQNSVRLAKSQKFTVQQTKTNITIIFRITHFIHRYQLYRTVGNWMSFFWCRAISMGISPIFAAKEGIRRRLPKIFAFFYPTSILKSHRINRWTNRLISVLLEQLFEVALFSPAHTPANLDKFITVEGWEHVESALQLGRGVIISSIHIGQFYHILGILLNRTYSLNGQIHQIEVTMPSSKENKFLSREFTKTRLNFHVLLSRDHQDMRVLFADALKKNHCLFMMQDYFNRDQLRVPFIYGWSKYSFLVPSPQTVSYFHIIKNIPVIPVVDIIDRDFAHTKLKFFPAVNIENSIANEMEFLLKKELDRNAQGLLSKKQQYGLFSTILNRVLYPYSLQYPFLWQEIFVFLHRSELKVSLGKAVTIYETVEIMISSLQNLLDNSYEPGRRDEEISQILHKLIFEWKQNETVLRAIPAPDIFTQKYIELGRLSFKQAVQKVFRVIQKYIVPNCLPLTEKTDSGIFYEHFPRLLALLQENFH